MRPWMCLLLCFQSVMCLLRFFVVVDIIGGFVELITVCVGWWAWYKDMNVSFIIFWGLMCFINGIFDVAYLIDFWAGATNFWLGITSMPGSTFDSSAPVAPSAPGSAGG